MKINIGLYLFLSMLLLSYGCASKGVVYKPVAPDRTVQKTPTKVEAPPAASTEEAKERSPEYENLKPPEFKRPVPEKKLPPREPFDPKRFSLTKDPVLINVEKMPLSDFIIYALGETLKVPFVMDQKVMENKEPITFSMPKDMPSDKALEIVLGIFERYNLYVEEKAGALYILHKPPEPKQPFDIKVGREIPESPTQILQVVPLRYIRGPEIETLLKEMYKTGIQIRPYPRENVLLFYGQASQVKQVMEFIETFDVPYMRDKKVAMLRLTYWQIEDFIKQISQIFEGMGLNIAKSPKDPGIILISIKPLGSILVVAPDDTSLNYVLHWKESLDTPEAAGAEERVFTYTPRYSKASDLVESIKKLYGIVSAPKVAPSTPAAPAASTASGRAPAAQPAPAAVTGLKISSDDQKNIIMILLSPAEYKQILSLLKDLDVPPRQVLIEATVAELTLTDDLKYGLEWYIKNRMFGGGFNLGTTFGVPTGPGLVYQFVSDTQKFTALINAFATEDKVRILSTPRLMVLDNQEATIQVGTDIPIVTGEVTAADVTQTQPSILRNIQYRNTGVILKVKPTINTEGLLTLNISQEVSEMGTNPPGIDSPTILMRRITTSIVAAHGESITLGGLMSESKTLNTSKIPLLGDIPVIGPLFQTTSKENRKTELLIFLTATILTSIDEMSKITRDLKKELKWLK
jgi:general secretion pathway protein D